MPIDCQKELEETIDFLCEAYDVSRDEVYGDLKDLLHNLSGSFSLLIFPNGKVLDLWNENHFLYSNECWNPPFVTVRMLNNSELFVRVMESVSLKQIAVLRDLIKAFPVREITVEIYNRELGVKVPYRVFQGFELRKFVAYLRQFLKH